jgi:hypothetical protein
MGLPTSGPRGTGGQAGFADQKQTKPIFPLEPLSPHPTTDTRILGQPMLRIANIQTLRTMNFIFGMALLMMISPQHGHLPEKPAGLRTAVELVGKRTALRTVALGAAFA